MTTVVLSRREASVTTSVTTDRVMLRAFLDRDPLLAAYAICDLDDREFPRTRWGTAWSGGSIIAIVLEYSGGSPQPLFMMGRDDGIEAILQDVIRPRFAYVAALPDEPAGDPATLPARCRPADDPDDREPPDIPSGRRSRRRAAVPVAMPRSSIACTSWGSGRGCHRSRSARASTSGCGFAGVSSRPPARTSSVPQPAWRSSATS